MRLKWRTLAEARGAVPALSSDRWSVSVIVASSRLSLIAKTVTRRRRPGNAAARRRVAPPAFVVQDSRKNPGTTQPGRSWDGTTGAEHAQDQPLVSRRRGHRDRAGARRPIRAAQ